MVETRLGEEEFVRLAVPAQEDDGGSEALVVDDEPASGPFRTADRQVNETWQAGGELLPEEVYPIADGRLQSEGALARGWRRVQRALDSGPERAEGEVDRRLRAAARRPLQRTAVIASLSQKGGTGKTCLALLIAQLISVRLRWPTLVVDTDFTGGTAREHIPSEGQRNRTLVDALEAIEQGRVRGPADVAPFVSVVPGGAHLLPAPRDPVQLSAITEAGMRRLLEALEVIYPVTILDCAPGIGLRDPAQKVTHELASDLLAVVLPRRVDAEHARWTLGYVARQYPETPLTVVVNQMPRRLDEGARAAQQVRLTGGWNGAREVRRVELPYDESLERQLDAAALDVAGLHQRTRIAVKQLVATLAEGWVGRAAG